jgi:hypothetical protein
MDARDYILKAQTDRRAHIVGLFTNVEKAKTAQEHKMEKVMKEFKEGTLKDSHGNPVTDRKQAIAIAMSESENAK